jgi:hypothetical protein
LNNTFLESLDFPLFFDIIAVEINAFLHAVYHLLYVWIVEISRRAAKVRSPYSSEDTEENLDKFQAY